MVQRRGGGQLTMLEWSLTMREWSPIRLRPAAPHSPPSPPPRAPGPPLQDELVSQPYVDMTVKLMERFGVKVELVNGLQHMRIPSGQT